MEIASALVMLNGDRQNVVFKPEITPAEYQILRSIHMDNGSNPISNLQHVRDERRPHGEELERIRSIYGKEDRYKDKEGDPLPCPVNRIFGQFGARLPDTFAEIGEDSGVKAEVKKVI